MLKLKFVFLFSFLMVVFYACSEESTPTESEQEIYGIISGRITDSETGAGIQNVQVETTPPTSTVSTDSEGLYEIINVLAGTYNVQASKSAYLPADVEVAVDTGKTVQADVVLTKEKSNVEITGSIQNAVNGANISGVLVNLTSGAGNTTVVTLNTETDVHGEFEFSSLPRGEYVITASKNNYLDGTQTITTSVDTVTYKVEFQLYPNFGSITGYVRDRVTSLPISGVQITSSPATEATTTDSTGLYLIALATIESQTGTDYTVNASKEGYTDATVTVKVLPGDTTLANINM